MPAGIDFLVALVLATAAQRGIHVHVVTGHVQRDQALEDNSPPRPGRAQKDQQARSGAAVCHHVQHRTKGGRLLEITGRITI